MFLVDTCYCKLRQWRHFDTSSDSQAGTGLRDYLMNSVSDGDILVGVSGYEPTRYLTAALTTLSGLGVDVSDVGHRGAWVFVTKKGDTSMTVLDKQLTEEAANARQPNINVTLPGT